MKRPNKEKKNSYRVVVAHPYKQHSFELAEGLREQGLLYKYYTTVYYRKNNLTGFVACLLKGQSKKKAMGRSDNRIDKYVHQINEIDGLVNLFIMRIPFFKGSFEKIKCRFCDRFAKKVARKCVKEAVDAVVVYDDTSPIIAEYIKKKSPATTIILDMSAPALPFLNIIYKEDMIISPDYADMLFNERRNALDEVLLKRSEREILGADYYIVASEFSRKSLQRCGVEDSKIYSVRYGVQNDCFVPGINRAGDVLHCVFTGGTKQFKGLSYLLDAFSKMEELPVDLTIIGENKLSEFEMSKYKNVVFTGVVMPEEVSLILQKSDFMVFPSLGDGFGLSVTEALASGCPVICSDSTGASDIIEDYWNGFIIPTHNSEMIIRYVKYFIDNREKLKEMQKNARTSVKTLSWDKYYYNIGTTVRDILMINNNL